MQSLRRPDSTLLLGIGALLLAAVIAVTAVTLYTGPPGQRPVVFFTTDAASVRPGDPVRIAGVNVGRIDELDLQDDRVRVRALVDRDVFVGDRSQIQVRMRTVVGGHYTAIVSLGDTALGTEPIPADRVTLPYNLVRTVTDATRITDQVAAGSVHDTLDRVADGLRGDNAHTFATVLDAGNALTAAIDRQRGQLSTILHVSDEYLDALRGHTAELRAMLQKVSIIEATLVVYAEGFGRALAGMGDVLDGLNPVGQFYAGNSASFIEKVRNWQEIVATWAERSGLVVRGLRRVRDKLDRVLDAQNARPVLLATDLCIPLPDRAC